MISYETKVAMPFDAAEKKLTEELKSRGFGLLCRINVKEKLKEKINQDIEPYVILGVCNPGFAHEALKHDPSIGYVLPCNAVVSERKGDVFIGVVLPDSLASLFKNEEFDKMAIKAKKILCEAVDSVKSMEN